MPVSDADAGRRLDAVVGRSAGGPDDAGAGADGRAARTTLSGDRAASTPRGTEFVTVPFGDGTEEGGIVRLALRGDTLRATIVSAEPALRERLEPRLDSLRRTLVEHGFEPAALSVRSAAGHDDGARAASRDQTPGRDAGDPRGRDARGGRERRDSAADEGGRRRSGDGRHER
jgi:hypothetical protein